MTTPTFRQQMDQIIKTLAELKIERTRTNTITFELLVTQIEVLEYIHTIELMKGQSK